jgi:hypothetical protein
MQIFEEKFAPAVRFCLHMSKICCNFAPENDSKAKVSSLTHFVEAEFGNVNSLMLNFVNV